MPSFTFAAAVEAVIWAGLEPVFLDVGEESWHLDPAALDAALERHAGTVGAVLAASTFGTPPSIAERAAWELATRHAGVPLLVDSAAGFGANDELGAPLGRQGDAEVFSFHATKTFAIGEGGLVTTTSSSLAARLARLKNFGFRQGIVDEDIGLNAKLAEWPAATALAVLDRYSDIVAARRTRAERMLAELMPLGYTRQRGSERGVWQFVPVLAPSRAIRDLALELARRRGIELRSYFSVPLHCMPAFSGQPVAGHMRRTDDIASRVLSLPMANDLSEAAIESVVDCLATAASATHHSGV
jgi:dTDP-4-amino-4,6-dideoxygalactose transaminase